MRAYRDPNTRQFIPTSEQPSGTIEQTREQSPEAFSGQASRNLGKTDAHISGDNPERSAEWVKSPVPGGGSYIEAPKNLQAPLKAEKRDGRLEIGH